MKISKRKLSTLVAKELKGIVHSLHILSVINILIDEIVKELKNGNSIKIINFGTLSLKNMKPKKFLDLSTRKILWSKQYKTLRFKLTKKISKIMKISVCEENQEK